MLTLLISALSLLSMYVASQLTTHPITQSLLSAALVAIVLSIPCTLIDRWNTKRVQKLTARLDELTTTDEQTGLSNRRYFEAHYERERARSERTSENMCLLMMQIDNVEGITQQHGQKGFANALTHLADFLSLTLRFGTDEVARWDDHQFVVLLTETTKEGGLTAAERLRQRIEGLNIQYNDKKVRMTVSISVITCRPGEMLDSVLEKAADCMSDAALLGANNIVPYLEAKAELVLVAG